MMFGLRMVEAHDVIAALIHLLVMHIGILRLLRVNECRECQNQ